MIKSFFDFEKYNESFLQTFIRLIAEVAHK